MIMGLRFIDEVSEPGGVRLNEDRVGGHGALGWVVDGATSLEESPFLPAASDVQWLVDYVDNQLRELSGEAQGKTGEMIFSILQERAKKELARLGFPSDRVHPACSIGLCLVGPSGLELARVGDVTCVAAGEKLVELSTDYFNGREAAAVRAANATGNDDARAGILARRLTYIQGREEESVFSGHPDGVLRTYSARVAGLPVDSVLICSDGFARAITDYDLYGDWEAIVSDAMQAGLGSIVKKIRDFEVTSDGGWHFKRSDDASAVLAEIS